MEQLQRTLDRLPQKVMQTFLGSLIAKKAAAHGVKLSARKQQTIARRILAGETRVTFDRWKVWQANVAIDFTSEDLDELKKATHSFGRQLPELVASLIETTADAMLADLRKRWRKHSRLLDSDVDGFRKRLGKLWGHPIGLLRMLHTMALETGSIANGELARSATIRTTPRTFDVLRRSHARACQVGAEVVTLLGNGFADGAMARWRTLHEIAVVAALISRHGEELAERYVWHEVVESKRAADEYQRCAPRLGFHPLTDLELANISKGFDEAIAKYGAPFGTPYGWAAELLQVRRPTFAEIERAADVEHLRAYYRLASHNVHSNPKGIFYQLGLMRETPLLLAGASNAGLTEPAQGTAISLLNITASFVSLQPTFDNAVALRAMTRLCEEIPSAFADVEEKVKARTLELRQMRDDG